MRFELTTTSLATRNSTTELHPHIHLVRLERLELSRCEAQEPKSCVSTNSTTAAVTKSNMVPVERLELPTY